MVKLNAKINDIFASWCGVLKRASCFVGGERMSSSGKGDFLCYRSGSAAHPSLPKQCDSSALSLELCKLWYCKNMQSSHQVHRATKISSFPSKDWSSKQSSVLEFSSPESCSWICYWFFEWFRRTAFSFKSLFLPCPFLVKLSMHNVSEVKYVLAINTDNHFSKLIISLNAIFSLAVTDPNLACSDPF